MKINIGKNTLGDNDKMSVSLREYDRLSDAGRGRNTTDQQLKGLALDFWFPFQAKLKAVSATILKQSKNLTVEHPGPIPIRMSEDDIDVFNYVNDQGEISREMDARSDELVEIDPYWLATQIEQCDELLQNLVNRSEVLS